MRQLFEKRKRDEMISHAGAGILPIFQKLDPVHVPIDISRRISFQFITKKAHLQIIYISIYIYVIGHRLMSRYLPIDVVLGSWPL